MNWQYLNDQMQTFASDLHTKVRLTPEVSKKLASNIAAEVRFLSAEQKAEIKAASPVPLADRLTELQTFQKWMEQSGRVKNNPFVTRAQVLTQSYICFVYLPEACFRVLAKVCPSGSATKGAPSFLVIIL